MSFKNFFLNESSDKTIIKLTDASKAQELEQYLSTSSIQFSKTADDVFEIMSPKSVVAKLPFEAEFLDNINESEDTTTGYTLSFANEAIDEVMKSAKAIPLSQINPVVAKQAVEMGHEDGSVKDDQITYKKATIAVNQLKGAQTEIIPEKAIQMALGMMLTQPLKIGGDLGSMISGDNYIMDGHHRWAATYLCDPKASVSGTQISLKGELLVTALNVVTKGQFNRNGNPGKGNIKDFTAKVIKPILIDYAENGIPGQFPMQADEVKVRLGRVPGAKGDYLAGIEIMSKNADALPKSIMPGAPDRIDMPVINPEEVHKVADDIAKGKIDITKPYANESAKTYVSILDPYAHDKAFINNVRNLIKHIKTKAKEAKVKPDAAFIDNIVSANNDRYQFGGIIYNLHDYERATFNKELNTYINESFVNESATLSSKDSSAIIDIANQFAEIPEDVANLSWSSLDSLIKTLLDYIPSKHQDAFDTYSKAYINKHNLNESADYGVLLSDIPDDLQKRLMRIELLKTCNIDFKNNTIKAQSKKQLAALIDFIVINYSKTVKILDEFLNESIESDSIINDLQKLDAKLELYHHNTKAFSQHKAYDEIYAAFDFYKDDLIEKIIGYTGDRYKSVSVQVEYTDTTGIELVSDLADLSLNLASFAEANGYSDLKNISDSLSGLSAKLNYLLTLNEAVSSYYVTCIDGSDMFWNSKVDEKLMFDRLEDAHAYSKSKRHGNEYWYCVYNAATNSELLQERTKFVNGKFVTNYLK